jgi:succinate dehydrogenase/fumarate reductase-like Fe-S protein
MTNDIVRVTVERYNPATGRRYAESYDVPRGLKLRVLDSLDYILREIDPSLGHRRHLCKAEMCNGCLMTVNGKPRLACRELVSAGQHEISLGPLQGRTVLKDLVVDFEEGTKYPISKVR